MKLILCGGGSGEQNINANTRLNQLIDHSKPILYIPLALDEREYPYDGCYEWISSELAEVDVSNIEMVRTFESLASKKLHNYSAIFIGGGNTYKLLKGIKDSGAFEKIKNFIENDGVIIGGSAGAVIFGKDINIISKMDPNNVKLDDTRGFDVLDGISIFPHYTNSKAKFTAEENHQRMNMFTDYIVEYSKRIGKVIAIPEEDAISIDGDTVEVIGVGKYYEFNNGEKIAKEPKTIAGKKMI